MSATVASSVKSRSATHPREANRVSGKHVAFLIGAYLLATIFTTAHFGGDTPDYVASVLTGVEFWEFGHVLWRPLGWLLFKSLYPITSLLVGEPPALNVTAVLITVNWISGIICVVALYRFLTNVCGERINAVLITAAFILSHGFLNFAQTGSSYVPGLALFLVGLCLVSDPGAPGRTRSWILGGLALAGAVAMWFPYAFVVPAALALPPLIRNNDRRAGRFSLNTAITFSAAICLIYLTVMSHSGIDTAEDVRQWVAAANHGIESNGIVRMALGVPRSLINIGNDGLLLKRFLLQDPYNPVSAAEVIRLTLWKVGLFYLCAAAVAIKLIRSNDGKRVLILLGIGSLPLLAFAVFFDTGAVERYLPIHPLIFLGLCRAMRIENGGKTPILIVLFLLAMSLANFSAMAKPIVDRKQDETALRIREMLPLRRGSVIVTINLQDELVNFTRSFPFHRINRAAEIPVRPLVALNTSQVMTWRQEFAASARSAWQHDGDVWVSARLLTERPHSDWYWVEGADPRVNWTDLHRLISQMEFGAQIGGADGFVLLLPSPKNRELLGSQITSTS